MKIDKGRHQYIQAVNASMDNRVTAALDIFLYLIEEAQDKKISMAMSLRLGDLWILVNDAIKEAKAEK